MSRDKLSFRCDVCARDVAVDSKFAIAKHAAIDRAPYRKSRVLRGVTCEGSGKVVALGLLRERQQKALRLKFSVEDLMRAIEKEKLTSAKENEELSKLEARMRRAGIDVVSLTENEVEQERKKHHAHLRQWESAGQPSLLYVRAIAPVIVESASTSKPDGSDGT